MDREEMLQQLINSTVERFGKQSINYEAEIANLNAQILMLKAENTLLQNDKNLQESDGVFEDFKDSESEYDSSNFDEE